MASLASIATGNFTAAGTWAVCDSTSENDSIAANTLLTTSFVASSTFTPGAITIDAFGVKVASRAASPSGTMTIELFNSTDALSIGSVTINVSDIVQGDTSAQGGCGWYFFSIGSTLLTAGKAYSIRAKTSSANQVNLFSLATTNWTRQLRTTTTQAPAAADKLFVQGQWTAAATSSSYTVTMNETATTAYADIMVGNKGTLAYGTTASTNYYLKCQYLEAFAGSTFKIGDSGTAMPSTSTAILEFNSTSVAQYGLNIHSGATFNAYGATRSNVRSFMTADKAAAATSIVVTDTTGWAANDEIAFPSTTRTIAECEKKTISSITNGTTFVCGALTNAHSGTSPIAAECANLTRNVKIRGVSTSNTGHIACYPGCTVDVNYVEVYQSGGNISNRWSVSVRGISIGNTSGSFSWRNSSVHDNTNAASYGFQVTTASGVNVTISNNIIYGLTGTSGNGIDIGATSATHVIDSNYYIGGTNAGIGINNLDAGSTITNNKCVGAGNAGILVNESGATMGTFSGNTAHSNGTSGFNIIAILVGTLSSLTAWRNNDRGIFLSTNNAYGDYTLLLDTATLFGNTTAGISIFGYGNAGTITCKSFTVDAGTTLTQTTGLKVEGNTNGDGWFFDNCTFGATNAHSTGDVVLVFGSLCSVILSNCLLASSTEVANISNTYQGRFNAGLCSANHDQVNGSFRQWSKNGTNSTDTVIFRTASPSLRMTPLNSTPPKQIGANKIIPVASGATVTVSVYVRKSVIGDGTAYNGNQPRLMLRKNYGLGITADTVIATATVASNGAWELLTGTSAAVTADGALEFFVDCDGTTGWVNVDDFTTTATTDPSGLKYWFLGSPALNGGNVGSGGGSSGGSFTFC